jgi:hypothetical protein
MHIGREFVLFRAYCPTQALLQVRGTFARNVGDKPYGVVTLGVCSWKSSRLVIVLGTRASTS